MTLLAIALGVAIMSHLKLLGAAARDLPALNTEKREDDTVKSVATGVTFLSASRQERGVGICYVLPELTSLF